MQNTDARVVVPFTGREPEAVPEEFALERIETASADNLIRWLKESPPDPPLNRSLLILALINRHGWSGRRVSLALGKGESDPTVMHYRNLFRLAPRVRCFYGEETPPGSRLGLKTYKKLLTLEDPDMQYAVAELMSTSRRQFATALREVRARQPQHTEEFAPLILSPAPDPTPPPIPIPAPASVAPAITIPEGGVNSAGSGHAGPEMSLQKVCSILAEADMALARLAEISLSDIKRALAEDAERILTNVAGVTKRVAELGELVELARKYQFNMFS